jgi:hypothetical protein
MLTAPTNANAFNITAGTATKLGFTTPLIGGSGGTAWTSQPVVAIQDANGNTVTTAPNTAITLAILNNAGPGGTLMCTSNPVTTSSGVATFAGCEIDKAGNGYTLRATGGSFTQADSDAFNISVGAAAGITITNASNKSGPITPSCTGTVGSLTCDALGGTTGNSRFFKANVMLVDAGGNAVVNSGAAISVTVTGTGISGSPLTIANGQSTSTTQFNLALPNGSNSRTYSASATVNAHVVTVSGAAS